MGVVLATEAGLNLPEEVRTHLGLQPSDEVNFQVSPDGRVFLERAPAKQLDPDRFRKAGGSLDLGMTVDAFMEMMRGPPE